MTYDKIVKFIADEVGKLRDSRSLEDELRIYMETLAIDVEAELQRGVK